MARAILISVLFPLLALSCSYPKACFDNLVAVYEAESGNYGSALAGFARAGSHDPGRGAGKYTDYNTASVYSEMGELESAEVKLLSIDPGDDHELEIWISRELGAIAYKSGDYKKAAEYFKKAILIDNSDIKLIRNFELALLMHRESSEMGNGLEGFSGVKITDRKAGGNPEKLLELLFSGEVPFWLEQTGEKGKKEKDW